VLQSSKIIRGFLSCALLLSFISFGASSAAASTYNAGTKTGTVNCTLGGVFTVTSGVITGNTNCAGVAAIPDGVTSIQNGAFLYNTVLTSVTFGPSSQLTTIGLSAFQYATALTSIALPSSLTSIGIAAFQSATSLSSITIPDSVTSIGQGALSLTPSLTSVTLPSNLTTISPYLFQAAGITSITIPNSVTSIGQGAFITASSLTTVNIPAATTSIGSSVFVLTPALTAINVNAANPSFSSIDGVLFDKQVQTLLKYPEGKVGNPYELPSTVTSISAEAFEYSGNPTAFTYAGDMSDAALEAAGALGKITFSGLSLLDGSSTIQIANFDPQSTYTAISSSGVATISSTGLITVRNLSPDQTVTLTVTRAKAGFIPRIVTTTLRSQVAPMLPTNKPTVTLSDTLITCTIGSYSATPTSSAFSLFVDGKHVSTIFSALGDYLPDWIIPWATSSTITRTATLTSATWSISDAYRGKSITCATLAYSKNAIGFTASQALIAR
jgi:hypothetical protein